MLRAVVGAEVVDVVVDVVVNGDGDGDGDGQPDTTFTLTTTFTFTFTFTTTTTTFTTTFTFTTATTTTFATPNASLKVPLANLPSFSGRVAPELAVGLGVGPAWMRSSRWIDGRRRRASTW